MLATIDWFLKWSDIEQSVEGKSAMAVPQLEGSGEMLRGPEVVLREEERGKNQIRMPASRSSIA